MRRYLLVVCSLLLSSLTLATTAFSQEETRPLDLGIKLLNPAILGLETTASARPVGSSGLSFTLASPGIREITLEITSGPVVIDSQRKLQQFLSSHGIRPDVNAESFVYYLNPDLPSIRDITKGTTLQLPMLRVVNKEELPPQPIIALLMEPKLKDSLRKNVESFRSIVKKKRKHFAPVVLEGLDAVDLSIDQFYEDRVAISRAMLDQVNGNLITLNSMLPKYRRKSGLFSKGAKLFLTKEDSEQFDLISADIKEKVEASQQGNPDVLVMARTFKNEAEVSSFIVCYIPEALYKPDHCDQSFYQRSSPTNENSLPVATYKFWAINPSDGITVSDVRRIQVRRGNQQVITVDLTIR